MIDNNYSFYLLTLDIIDSNNGMYCLTLNSYIIFSLHNLILDSHFETSFYINYISVMFRLIQFVMLIDYSYYNRQNYVNFQVYRIVRYFYLAVYKDVYVG